MWNKALCCICDTRCNSPKNSPLNERIQKTQTTRSWRLRIALTTAHCLFNRFVSHNCGSLNKMLTGRTARVVPRARGVHAHTHEGKERL